MPIGVINNNAKLDSILSESMEIEHHLHNTERWFGKKAVPNAEISVMDNVLTPFQIDSGNNAYGTGVCIIGSGDTPVRAGKDYFDIHQILIKASERTEIHKIRLAWGTDEATALAAEYYSERMVNLVVATGKTEPLDFMMPRIAVGTKVWANVWCANNTGTVDFFIGLHEYDE